MDVLPLFITVHISTMAMVLLDGKPLKMDTQPLVYCQHSNYVITMVDNSNYLHNTVTDQGPNFHDS